MKDFLKHFQQSIWFKKYCTSFNDENMHMRSTKNISIVLTNSDTI